MYEIYLKKDRKDIITATYIIVIKHKIATKLGGKYPPPSVEFPLGELR